MNRVNKWSQIIIFFLVLLLPIAAMNRQPGKVSDYDNKTLALAPSLRTEDGALNENFTTEFEEYWNDNIGFREQAIVGNIAASYALFGKFAFPNYMMGSDEHVFYSLGDLNIRQYQGMEMMNPAELYYSRINLEHARDYFAQRNIDFAFMMLPDKEAVYPEYYPSSILQTAPNSRMAQISSELQQYSDLHFFDMTPVLIEHKNDGELLYYKSYDSEHWNMNGAFLGYQETIRQLQRYEPALPLLEKEDFTIRVEKSPGTTNRLKNSDLLQKVLHFDDNIYRYEKNGGYLATQQPGASFTLREYPSWYTMHYTNPEREDLPRLLVIGDSYVHTYIIPMLAESFSETFFVYSSLMGGGEDWAEEVRHITDTFQPDIVLFEQVNRMNVNVGDIYSYMGVL